MIKTNKAEFTEISQQLLLKNKRSIQEILKS